jgi:hypothetical protein
MVLFTKQERKNLRKKVASYSDFPTRKKGFVSLINPSKRKRVKRHITNTSHSDSMPRRKRNVRYYPRARRMVRRARAKSGLNLTAGLIAGIVEPTFDQMVNQFAGQMKLPFGSVSDIAKVGIGYYFGKKPGTIGEVAKALGYIGLARIGSQVIGGSLFGNKTAVTTTTQGDVLA